VEGRKVSGRRLVAHGDHHEAEIEYWKPVPNAGPIDARPKKPAQPGEREIEEALRMMDSGEWAEARGRHFVAVYAIMFRKVYGITVGSELSTKRSWELASSRATRLLTSEFADDPADLAEYMRWLWARELGREKWRRQNRQDGGMLSLELCFSGRLVTEWRLNEARHGSR
jgi:hypothetical protein